VDAHGVEGASVARIVRSARVSRKTFYDLFADREDCFLGAFEHALSEASCRATEAYESERGWREGTRSALTKLLVFIDEEPRLSRLLILESLAGGEKVLRRRAEVLDDLARLIDRGRLINNRGSYPPPLTGTAVAGGVLAVLYAHLLQERREPLTDLLGPLMSMIVLPYLGSKAARHEIDRPGCPPGPRRKRVRHPAAANDTLEGLNMRLTYRSARVLMVIARWLTAPASSIRVRSPSFSLALQV
jgi:AcrR family transcriptional regulator